MDFSEKELEEKLREAGNKLSQFPTEVDELLPLLDQVENLLEKVEQSPSESIQNAYSQSRKALLAEPLLRHTDDDVQVAVASCISEITRITAPEAPYNDDQMKEVFQLIVSSFVNLSDTSSRSYDKRVSILETVAKVRSCVVMLDLECDGLISEMFQHFLSSIRDHHPDIIFTSMETIMTLVLEESEDVSVEFLTPILASLKKDDEEIPTVARKLAESVFAKCAVKLTPYLKQAVKSLGLSLDDYSKIVAAICNGSNGEVEHNDDNVSVEQLAGESKLTTSSDEMAQDAKERVTEEVPPEVQRSVKSVTNGMTDTGDEEMSNVSDSSKKPGEGNPSTKYLDVNVNKVDTDDLDTGNLVEVESKQERTGKRRRKKPSSTKPSRIGSDKEAEITCQKVIDKEADNLPDLGKDACISVGEDPRVDARASSEKEEEPPISSPKPLDSEGLPDKSLPKKVGLSKNEDNLALEDASVNSALGKAIAGTSGTEIKPERQSEKKKLNLAQEDALSMDNAPAEAADVNSYSEVKTQKRFGKKKENFVQEHELKDPHAAVVAASIGSSDSKSKSQKLSKKKKGSSGQENVPSEDLVSTKVSDGSSDLEIKAQFQPGNKKENLAQEDVQPVEPVSPKVDDEISDSEDKPQRRFGKKATPTKKTTSVVMKGKMLGGRGTSKIENEDNSDEEAEQLTQSAKEGDGGDSETKPLKQSGKEITSRRKGKPLKKSGKGSASDTKLSSKKQDTTNKEGDGSDSEINGDGSDSETKPLVQSGKEITSTPRGQPMKKTGKGNASETKLLSKKEDTTNKDKDSSKKDNRKRRAHGKNTKEKVLLKSQANDDDQDMIISPKSTSKPVKDEDCFEDPKANSKRKRTPGKDKVSGHIEYGANLVGARVKVWWPDDKQYYEGIIESFDPTKKKHKVSYTDGDEEVLVLQKEKWEFVDDGTMQEDANEDLDPDSSAKLRSRKKAKTKSEQISKQKQNDVSPRSGRGGAAATSKSKVAATKSGGKVDSKSKDKTSKTSSKFEENSESEDKSVDDVPGEASKSKKDDGSMSKTKEKSKLETLKTVNNTKGKTPQSGNSSNGTGKVKSSSSKVKDTGDSKGKSPDYGKTPESTKVKSADTSKAGKSGGKSGKKRRRGF